MYDDYELDYSFDYSFNLDEDYADTHAAYDLDEDHARDTHDYATLAYIHYA